jgi:hypothetical protein
LAMQRANLLQSHRLELLLRVLSFVSVLWPFSEIPYVNYAIF